MGRTIIFLLTLTGCAATPARLQSPGPPVCPGMLEPTLDKELIKNQRAIATVHHAFASSLKKRLDAAMAAAQRQVHEHCRATKSAPCVCTSYLFVALTLDSDGRIIGVMPLTTTGDGAIDGILIDAAQKAGSVGVVPASLLDDTGRTRLPFGFELELQ